MMTTSTSISSARPGHPLDHGIRSNGLVHEVGETTGNDWQRGVPLLKDERPWIWWPVSISYRWPVFIPCQCYRLLDAGTMRVFGSRTPKVFLFVLILWFIGIPLLILKSPFPP
jgi:hypothetical protein